MPVVSRFFSIVTAIMLACGVAVSATSLRAQPPGDSSDAERVQVSAKVVDFVKPVAETPDDDDLVKKLKERHNVAVKLFDARIAEYRRNVADLLQVLDAARLVVEAKLDLAPDRDAQLLVFEQAHEVATLIEGHFQKLRDAGLGSASDLERAKLARLNVEVQILKLKRQQP